MNFGTNDYLIRSVIIPLIVLIFSAMLHELGHAWCAYALGDSTAKEAGRLTLNPLKHLDPLGSLILPAILLLSGSGVVFAYAKPVPYNPWRLRSKTYGDALVAAAGPAVNMVLALIFGGVIALLDATVGNLSVTQVSTLGAQLIRYGYLFCMQMVTINLVLAFFNLIPIPPLDGSKLIIPFLSEKARLAYYRFQSQSMVLLFILIMVSSRLPVDPLNWYFSHTAWPLARILLGL